MRSASGGIEITPPCSTTHRSMRMPTAKTRWDTPWANRPLEEANNLNPAFCGELIFRSVADFHRTKQAPLPLPLSFVILPMVLHHRMREELPGNASAAFVAWAAEHGASLAELPERTTRLIPITRESLMFLLQYKTLQFER